MTLPTPTPRHSDPRVARVIRFFEHLAPADLDRLDEVYASDARFKDPFNEVHDIPGIRRVFAHMFDGLGSPRLLSKVDLPTPDSPSTATTSPGPTCRLTPAKRGCPAKCLVSPVAFRIKMVLSA